MARAGPWPWTSSGARPQVGVGRVTQIVGARSPGSERVRAACEPGGATHAGLVSESVSESLDGVGVGDHVAVGMQPCVEVAEGEGAVSAEDGATRGTQRDAHQRDGGGPCWGQGRVLTGWWAPTLAAWHDRPERVAKAAEAAQRGEALVGEGGDLSVDGSQLVDHLVPLDLVSDPGLARQAGAHPAQEQPVRLRRAAAPIGRSDRARSRHVGLTEGLWCGRLVLRFGGGRLTSISMGGLMRVRFAWLHDLTPEDRVGMVGAVASERRSESWTIGSFRGPHASIADTRARRIGDPDYAMTP